MKSKYYIFLLSGAIFAAVLVGFLGSLILGTILIAPAQRKIPPSQTTHFGEIEFQSTSGRRIKGWYGQHEQAVASVMLLHGVRSDRREMLERALLLYQNQINVLLFDFQAHGESRGDSITFGSREAHDVEGAFQFLQKQTGKVPIGALGFSLGGAAVLLSDTTQLLDFLILEAVYPDIETAISNRLTMRLGRVGALLTPLLSWQLRWRLGLGVEQIRPIRGLGALRCPLLIIGGTEDRRATDADSRRLFAAASEPKELWLVNGARHENFHAYAPAVYEQRVLGFINQVLAR